VPTASTQNLVNDAVARRIGVGAFNVVTLEHAEAIVDGAELAGVPVILQLSENSVRFHRGQLAPVAAAAGELAAAASVPVSVHLDHVEDVALLAQSLGTSVTSAMFDGSKLDFEENVSATRAAAEWAHVHSIHLEAELGEVGGKEGAHAPGVRTDPAEAARYVEATGVDSLAVAVGTTHAMATRTAAPDYELIATLCDAVPVPLVLHGSSGVTDEGLRKAIRAGIVKVNIGTILNVAFTAAVREGLQSPEVIDPRKYLDRARADMSKVVQRLLKVITDSSHR